MVLQAILCPLLTADGPSQIVIEGGTHAAQAPPFEFVAKTFLPLIERMGPQISAKLERHGFFPRGAGRIVVDIVPAALTAIECTDRGKLKRTSVEALVTGVPFEIATREIEAARKVLSDWDEDAFTSHALSAEVGPGNALLIEAEFDHVTEVMSGIGKVGLSAEKVGKTAAKRMAGYLASEAFAGPYLQDQLLLPFAMAGGGVFSTVKLSQHTATAMDLIQRFTGAGFKTREGAGKSQLIEVAR